MIKLVRDAYIQEKMRFIQSVVQLTDGKAEEGPCTTAHSRAQLHIVQVCSVHIAQPIQNGAHLPLPNLKYIKKLDNVDNVISSKTWDSRYDLKAQLW